MQSYIPFPDIDPALFTIELFGLTLALRWYALAYIAGLVLGWLLVRFLMRRPALWPGQTAPMPPKETEDLLTAMIVGVVLGGRLGFVLFYNPVYYLSNPLDIIKIWEGGMAFHGGFLGVVLGIIWFCRSRGYPMVQVGDAVALATPIGIFFGRLANFINGELWGRATTVSWGVLFPDPRAQVCPDWWTETLCVRHPSQLYEAALEGVVLFAVLLWGLRRGWLKRPGTMIGVFLLGYGLARTLVENYRQADPQFMTADNPVGHVIQMGTYGLTMGQLLSLPMVAAGLIVLALRRRAE